MKSQKTVFNSLEIYRRYIENKLPSDTSLFSTFQAVWQVLFFDRDIGRASKYPIRIELPYLACATLAKSRQRPEGKLRAKNPPEPRPQYSVLSCQESGLNVECKGAIFQRSNASQVQLHVITVTRLLFNWHRSGVTIGRTCHRARTHL